MYLVDSGQLPVVSRQRQSRAARRASELGPSQIELQNYDFRPPVVLHFNLDPF